MSADNWALCPRCMIRHQKAANDLYDKATAAYGTIPVNEWKDLDEAARLADTPLAEKTFREDYEIGVDEDGLIEVSYSGHCSKCALHTDFKHSVQIEGLSS